MKELKRALKYLLLLPCTLTSNFFTIPLKILNSQWTFESQRKGLAPLRLLTIVVEFSLRIFSRLLFCDGYKKNNHNNPLRFQTENLKIDLETKSNPAHTDNHRNRISFIIPFGETCCVFAISLLFGVNFWGSQYIFFLNEEDIYLLVVRIFYWESSGGRVVCSLCPVSLLANFDQPAVKLSVTTRPKVDSFHC